MCLCCFYFLLLSNTQCWINICWSFAQSSSEVIHLFMLSQTVVMVPWLQTSREMTLLWDQLRQGAAMQISLTKDNVQACRSAAKAKGSPASLQLPHVHCFHTPFIDFFFVSFAEYLVLWGTVVVLRPALYNACTLSCIISDLPWAFVPAIVPFLFSWLLWVPWPLATHEWNYHTIATLPFST